MSPVISQVCAGLSKNKVTDLKTDGTFLSAAG